MQKTGLKISGLIALLSFGVLYLFANKDKDIAFIFGIIFAVSIFLFIISAGTIYGKKREAERVQEDMEILNRAREEGIAQARAEAAMRQNVRHGPVASTPLTALMCPVCLGSGKNAGGYTCPRCNGVGRA